MTQAVATFLSPDETAWRTVTIDNATVINLTVARVKNSFIGVCIPGGYRDVKVSLKLHSVKAALGDTILMATLLINKVYLMVMGHVCEVQCHLLKYWELMK